MTTLTTPRSTRPARAPSLRGVLARVASGRPGAGAGRRTAQPAARAAGHEPRRGDAHVAVGQLQPLADGPDPRGQVDVFAVPVTYIRTFSLGGRFARLFVTAPLATLDASGTVVDPRTGEELEVSRGRSGWMDPMVTLHVGLVGAPALAPAEFVKHPKAFQMFAIVGTAIPIGTYDSTPGDQPGHQPVGVPAGPRDGDALGARPRPGSRRTPSCCSPTTTTCSGRSARGRRIPLFISENHVTHAFDPKWWGSVDLRWQIGGETQSDGVDDDNRTNILGGGRHARPHVHPRASAATSRTERSWPRAATRTSGWCAPSSSTRSRTSEGRAERHRPSGAAGVEKQVPWVEASAPP